MTWTSWILFTNLIVFDRRDPDLCDFVKKNSSGIENDLLSEHRGELEVHHDDDNEVSFNRSEIFPGFILFFVSAGWDPSEVSCNSSLRSSPNKIMLPQNWLSKFMFSSKQFCRAVCDLEHEISTVFGRYYFLCIDPTNLVFWNVQFPTSSMCAIKISPIQTHPATNACPKNILVRFSSQNDGVLTGLSQRSDDIQQFAPNGMIGPFAWFSQSSLMRCLPICQWVLNISQMAIPLHGISPTFFIQFKLQ